MKKSNKGFTIVELVIVIAVIAVLASVLIPTFSNLINSANKSADTQLIRNLNQALSDDKTLRGGQHATMSDVLAVANNSGLDVAKINAKGYNNEILWDSVNDVFCYYDSELGTVEYIPDTSTQTKLDKTSYKYWQIVALKGSVAESTVDGMNWSVYLASSEESVLTTSTGLDVGECDNITSISYSATSGNDVVIRTNSASTTLTIDAAKDTVRHYDVCGIVEITRIANASYHEYGTTNFVQNASGRVVAEEGGKIETCVLTSQEATADVAAAAQEDGGVIVNCYATTNTVAEANNVDNKNIQLEVSYYKDATNPGDVLTTTDEQNDSENISKTIKDVIASEKYEASPVAANEELKNDTSSNYECHVNGIGCDTFEEAITAAQGKAATIVLLKDVDLTKYTEDENSEYIINLTDDVLDLNGHTITAKNHGVDYCANGNGCTIKNGTFTCENNGSYGLCLAYSNGKIIVDGVITNGGINVHACDDVVINNSTCNGTTYYAVWVEYGSNVIINSGTYTSTSTVGNAVFDTADNHTCTLTINGGNIVANGDNVVIARNDVVFSTDSTATCNKNPGDDFVDKPYGFIENDGSWSVAKAYNWKVSYTVEGGTSNFTTQAEAVAYCEAHPENCYVDGTKMPLYVDHSQSTKAGSEISISDNTTYYRNGSAMTAKAAFDEISTSSGWGPYGISNGYIYKKVATTIITEYFKSEADADAFVAQHSGATKTAVN